MECLPCAVQVIKTIPKCGHSHLVPCGENPDDFSNQCSVLINFTWSCGHTAKIMCGQRELKELQRCSQPCFTRLKCGHICGGTCGSCYMGRIHQPCQVRVTKTLDCGHIYKGCCKTQPECTEICPMSCDHLKCTRLCREPCVPCNSLCSWQCKHYKCTKLCSEICNRPRCNRPCNKLLQCKHKCIGLCGEPCPTLCRKCHKKGFDKKVFGLTVPHSRYVLIENCGHLVESLYMDRYMLERQKKNKLGVKNCPVCKTIITKCRRYGNILKQISIVNERNKMNAIAGIDLLQDLKCQLLKFSAVDIKSFIIRRDIDSERIDKNEALSKYPCHYFRWKCKKEFEDRIKDVNRRIWSKKECSSVYEQISFALEVIDVRQGIMDNDRKTTSKSEVEQDYISFLYELLLNVAKPRQILNRQEIEDFKAEIQRGRTYINLLKKASEFKSSNEESVIFQQIQTLLTVKIKFSTSEEICRSDEQTYDLKNKTGKSHSRTTKTAGVSFDFVQKCTCDRQLFEVEDKDFHCCISEIQFGFGSDKKDRRSKEVIQSEESSMYSAIELSVREMINDGLLKTTVSATEDINADDFDESKVKKPTPAAINIGSDFLNLAGEITFGDFSRPVEINLDCIQTDGDVE